MRIGVILLWLLVVGLCREGVACQTEEAACCCGQPQTRQAEAGGVNAWLGKLQPGLSINRTSYILLANVGSNVDDVSDSELKFQISIKQHIYWGLYFGYTQKSFWRIWDGANSRPFRETNYNPEIFWRSPEFDGGPWGKWQVDVSPIEHESNGQGEPDSRSWNRAYIRPRVGFGWFEADLKLWHRYSEEVKRFPEDPAGDENPDIQDYLGHGELRLGFQSPWQARLDLMGRCNLHSRKGAVQAELSVPLGTGNASLYFQFFNGYGESLIDYDRSLTTFGAGFRVQ